MNSGVSSVHHNPSLAATQDGGSSAPPRPRQLRMRRPHLSNLPPVTLPTGYSLRTYQPGDEAHWAAIMNSEGGIGSGWTREMVHAKLLDKPQFDPAGLFFATCNAEGGRPVASATAWRVPPEETRVGYIHMVCALEEHRGRGLGRLVDLAVLHYFRARNFSEAILETDDWRIAAIGGYLDLGFVPVFLEDPASDHQVRWSAIFQNLQWNRRT